MSDLLLELLSEEIPARMQRKAANDLKKLVTDGLVGAGLTYEAAQAYSTPRRLTLDIRGLSLHSKDQLEERKGPSIYAEQQVIAGFLRSAGLDDVSQAEVREDAKKGKFYVAKIVKKGRTAEAIIAEIIPQIIRSFPWPKSMRWGKTSAQQGSLKWVRPLQNILCVFGPEVGETEVIDFEVAGFRTNRVTFGHRFMSDDTPIEVRRFDDYVAKLELAHVILDADRRKEIILADARNLAFAKGLELVEDDQLAEEVAGLVEWPVVLMGEFASEFLVIPPEVIRLTIRTNQKCFVLSEQGQSTKLSNHFILVSNIVAIDKGTEIAFGNGKVVRARLSDALYFWQRDQADLPDLQRFKSSASALNLDLHKPLDQRMARLDQLMVTFHAKLGTQGERVCRIAQLAQTIAPLVGADVAHVKRAAMLAKADLQTEVVGEFPELQGIMGRKYALLQGENPSVAAAIEEHYKPIGPNDRVPRDSVSVAVALADKIDTLVGFWLINERPTGSKDPYALRRAALGAIRLLLSKEWNLALQPIFRASFATFSQKIIDNAVAIYEQKLGRESANKVDGAKNLTNALHMEVFKVDCDITEKAGPIFSDLLSFFQERLRVYLREEGARYDAIDAVLTPLDDDFLSVARRVEAIILFLNSKEGGDLIAGIKRAANILDAEKKKATQIAAALDPSLLMEPEEKRLFREYEHIEQKVQCLMNGGDYGGALHQLALLRKPIDEFFEKVLVNDENLSIRANRLTLLAKIHQLSAKIADFSKLTC